MFIKDKDKKILKFVEDYKVITINQCSKIVYTGHKYGYDEARKRLKKLYNNKLLKSYTTLNNTKVYYVDKKLSYHDIKVFDIYAEIINLGGSIKYFKRVYPIKTHFNQYYLDAFIEFKLNGKTKPLIIEIDYNHFTSAERMLDIYDSQHFQNRYSHTNKIIFPKTLIVRPNISKFMPLPFHVRMIDFSLEGLKDSLLN